MNANKLENKTIPSLSTQRLPDKNNQILKITYTRYHNFCNRLLRKLKILYEKNELLKSKHDLKATWKRLKRITNTEKPRNPPEELLKLSVDFKTSTQ